MKKGKFLLAFAVVAFLGISFEIRFTNRPARLHNPLAGVDVSVLGPGKLYAGTSDSWGFVRGSATWGRSNSSIVDSLLTSLQSSGIFSSISSGEVIVTNQTSSDGTSYNYRVNINQGYTVTSTAFNGSKTFNHRFEAWRTTDTDHPTLQMFFDSTTSTGDDGVLLFYDLSRLSPSTFSDATGAVVESYTSGTSGNMQQTYSWSGGPESSSWLSKTGRVIIREMNSGAEICVRTVVEINRGSTGVGTSLDTLCANSNSLANSSSTLYYTLAYIQKTSSPFYTVAKSGLVKKENSTIKNTSTYCGYDASPTSSITSLPLYYGLFDSNGFISDGNAASAVPADYPSTTDVDNAFSRTGASLNDVGSDGITVAEYDQSNASFLNGLSLSFVSSTAPSCSSSVCQN
ncbi:MAG: hypothetical protein AAF518_02185 [Spirochaetota bacterium]